MVSIFMAIPEYRDVIKRYSNSCNFFKPLKSEEYTDKDLNTYYKILRESVAESANKNGKTWVSSFSGWNSSILLGMLVNEFGSKKVGMLKGSMQYSNETVLINKFEIDK